MSVTHSFQESLNKSHSASDMPVWERIYRKAFPEFCAMVDYRDNGEHQKAGIDRGVYLKHAKEIMIDEKVREKDYGDILLEYVSNDRTGAPGWVCKPLRADYVAYLVIPSDVCYLLPVVQMQAAWQQNNSVWIESYGTKAALNHGYRTLNCPVPVNELFAKIGSCLRVRLNDS